MFNFFKNVVLGLGGLIGAILALGIVMILGGGLWLILSAIGLITIGAVRFLFWLVFGGLMTITILWLIGYVMTGSKNAQ